MREHRARRPRVQQAVGGVVVRAEGRGSVRQAVESSHAITEMAQQFATKALNNQIHIYSSGRHDVGSRGEKHVYPNYIHG
jgi:hypothetical protein